MRSIILNQEKRLMKNDIFCLLDLKYVNFMVEYM